MPWKKSEALDLNSAYLNVRIMKSSDLTTPSKYYFVASYRTSAKYFIKIFQTNGFTNTPLQDTLVPHIEIGPYDSSIQKPFIVNHPLSTKLLERSTNFKGDGISPKNKYDDSFLHTKSYTNLVTGFATYDVCLRHSSNFSLGICIDNQLGFPAGLSPIPQTSSVLVMSSNTFSSPTTWMHKFYSITMAQNGSENIILQISD